MDQKIINSAIICIIYFIILYMHSNMMRKFSSKKKSRTIQKFYSDKIGKIYYIKNVLMVGLSSYIFFYLKEKLINDKSNNRSIDSNSNVNTGGEKMNRFKNLNENIYSSIEDEILSENNLPEIKTGIPKF